MQAGRVFRCPSGLSCLTYFNKHISHVTTIIIYLSAKSALCSKMLHSNDCLTKADRLSQTAIIMNNIPGNDLKVPRLEHTQRL